MSIVYDKLCFHTFADQRALLYAVLCIVWGGWAAKQVHSPVHHCKGHLKYGLDVMFAYGVVIAGFAIDDDRAMSWTRCKTNPVPATNLGQQL
jgi:hypothetical protein